VALRVLLRSMQQRTFGTIIGLSSISLLWGIVLVMIHLQASGLLPEVID
jgi:hypothetical protein